jgi:aspartate dehydrogenase
MKTANYKVKIGIVGCGAIGSGIAKYIEKNLNKDCKVTGIFDIDIRQARALQAKLKRKGIVKKDVTTLIKHCDCMIEAINSTTTKKIIKQAIEAKKTVLAMSVGKLLNSRNLFKLARENKCYILLPSGAIAGVDAIKAASLKKIKKITLTTRKPPQGLKGNPYFEKQGIDLDKIKKETVVFEGDVASAVKNFPQNINVAATIALASEAKNFKVKIMTSPHYKGNTHEVEMEGDFGRMTTRTDNIACPDNPKSSYLAVLSGIQTLKQYCTGILIGT